MLTGDSFFHLSALGEALPGLNLCGAGRVVCLIDPVERVESDTLVGADLAGGAARDVESHLGIEQPERRGNWQTNLVEFSREFCASLDHRIG